MKKISRRLCIFALSIIQATYISAALTPEFEPPAIEEMPLYPLHYAAMQGDTTYVEMYVQEKNNVNLKAAGGIYPLHCAALNNHPDIVAALVNAGAFIAVKDDEGYTPLHLAAQQGAFECLVILLKKQVEANIGVDKKNDFNETALHCASKNGHASCIIPLVEAGSNVHERDQDDCTPLFYATTNGHADCVEKLLACSANCMRPFLGKKLEYWARERGFHNIAIMLMQAREQQEQRANQPKLKME